MKLKNLPCANTVFSQVALYMSAWTMMEQPSPGRTIGERRFIRNKKVR
ncbi:hypothetical protein [Paenibacillus polymyxa]|nr:hypothetical protein [Paenibacillus polymyxa]